MVKVPKSEDALMAANAAQQVVHSWCMMLYDCYVLTQLVLMAFATQPQIALQSGHANAAGIV